MRFWLAALVGLVLLGLAACDTTSAPPTQTPVATPAAGQPIPTNGANQLPDAVVTGGAVPAAVPTGGAMPNPVPTGGTGSNDLSGGPVSTPTPDPSNPPRMTIDDLQKLLATNSVLLIDVRNPYTFSDKHIKGASTLPFEDLDKRVSEVPKDKLVVLYCQ
jgi:hypothetical protein